MMWSACNWSPMSRQPAQVLSTDMVAQRTAPKHQREQNLSGCTLSGKDAYLACKMFI
jgi:hypothetical protein